jgi:pSer/pThr/pTyr-binding forkhead associated (FHA) protein
MPPSGRKGKTRARRGAHAAEAHEPSDVDTPEAIATPSRVSRKRARGNDAPAPAARNTRRKTKDTRNLEREDTEGTEAHDVSDDGTEPALPSEVEIVASLKIADRQVNATEDFANDLLEGQENVPGYGKIAGRDWAFIIRKVEVNIGRPEAHERLPVEESAGRPNTPSHKTVVDIDLGPDRQVSRSHAIISYDGASSSWFIVVNGRNGLRVDNNLLKRGAKSFLRNGSVIEIAGTQMAFITTPNDEADGPVWDASIIRQAQKSSEEDDDGFDDPRINGAHPHAHPQHRGQLQDASRQPPQYNPPPQQQNRTHPHSQRAAVLNSGSVVGPPGTPLRPTTATMGKSSPSANYSRGINMESTESIDYSSDNAKDLKPPHSYAQLIGMAILSTHESQMTLNNIYKWIMANYAFYRHNTGGWQNSIRHNLSLNKAFTKIARRTDEPGKGMKWMIDPAEYDTFVQQGMKGCRRPAVQIPISGSTAASPSSPLHSVRNPPSSAMGIKRRDDETTPPLPHFQPPYPRSNEAFTPDRGSRRRVVDGSNMGLGINESTIDAAGQEAAYNLDFLRSTPRNGLTAAAHAAGSPPALYVNDEGRMGPMDTPFPLRPTARFAPPSTLRRPSDFIQFSSPAPFWKMEGLVGSTPFKPYDMSPLKTPFPMLKPKIENAEEEEEKKMIQAEEEEDEEKALSTGDTEDIKNSPKSADGVKSAIEKKPSRRPSPIIPSSSPPRATSVGRFIGAESPSITRPGTASSKGLSLLVEAGKEAEKLSESSDSGVAELQTTAQGGLSHGLPASHPLAAPPSLRPSPMISNGHGGGMHSTGSQNGYQQLAPPQQPTPQQHHQHQHQLQHQQHAYPGMNAGAQDDDDEGIDLAK